MRFSMYGGGLDRPVSGSRGSNLNTKEIVLKPRDGFENELLFFR
jgi:hypothetical protein